MKFPAFGVWQLNKQLLNNQSKCTIQINIYFTSVYRSVVTIITHIYLNNTHITVKTRNYIFSFLCPIKTVLCFQLQ